MGCRNTLQGWYSRIMNRSDTNKIEKYSKSRQVELAGEIAFRKKVYLDIRFWIFARDAMLGVRTDPDSRKLLHFLKRGVADGTIICPISATTFLEVMKQPFNSKKRIATADLIDELSLGVTLMPPQVVMGTEISHWLFHRKGVQEIHPMQELIWTKVSSVLGHTYPNWPDLSLSDDEEFELQKSFFDYMWKQPLRAIIEALRDSPMPSNDFAELSAETNNQNKIWAHEMSSFKAAYDIELRGAIEVATDVTVEILHQITDQSDGWPTSASKDAQIAMEKGARNLLYNGFKKGDAKEHIRSMHIGASIHAAMRRDRERQFEPNDFFDFQHATAALAYCDAFFTEKSLRDLASRSDLDLGSINGCRTISDIGTAVSFLKALT